MTTTTAPEFTGRSIGQCRRCKKVHNHKTFLPGYAVKCECGNRVTLKGIFASYSEKQCDGRCTGATGPQCDCQCGGENHGGAHAA